MAYLDIGFDEYLTRVEPSQNNQQAQELDPLAFDNFVDTISGDKISGGIMVSPDGKTKFDLEKGNFLVNNGVQDLVQFGVLPDGSVGLQIQDSQGNILMKVTEGEFFLESPLKTSRMDLIKDQYTVRDERGRLYVLLGHDPKGF